MSNKASGRIFDLSILNRIIAYVGPYRARFIFTGILVIVLAVLAPIRPWLIRKAVDNKIPTGDLDGLLFLFSLVVLVLIAETILQFYQTYFANWVAQSVTLDLRSKLYQHVLKFKLKHFDRTPVGAFVTRLISDIDGIAQIFSNGILTIIGDILKLVFVIAVMFFTHWKLTLIVLAPIPVLLIATKIFQVAIRKAFTQVRNQVSKMNNYVQEHVTGMAIVQIFNREKREMEKFKSINKGHMIANIKSIWAFSIFFPVVELLSASSVALLLWWGVGDVVDEKLTLGVMLQFILYIFMLYRPIRQLADRFNVLQMGIVNAERVFKVFDTKERIVDEGKIDGIRFKGNIEFKNVWFAYNDEDWVLKDISFKLEAGQTLAFVGATGAGKSSVINLLSRFYEFQKGEITIDGIPIRECTIDCIRQNIAVVLQDVFLFSDSIRNNISLNNSDISDEELIEASKAVGAHEFIDRLPGKYNFDVKERGGMLSVGQRQLLAFIRAYVYNPSILVLDEATSSVDTESEELIQNAIDKLTKGRSSIVIAHRLSTIQQADKIIVLEKGRLVEQGTHNDLLEQDGHYKRLFELQFQE